MAGIRLIRGRIKSAKNIAQITSAMQMVAASKMRKAQAAAVSGKPYAEKIYNTVAELSQTVDSTYHELLMKETTTGKTLVILISTNKGLCGSLNTNLFRKCISWFSDKKSYDFISIGSKGSRFSVRVGYSLIADFSQEIPFTRATPAVIDLAVNGFINGTYKEVIVVYNAFVNALTTVPTQKTLLPMDKLIDNNQTNELPSEFLIEPDAKTLLNALLPHYLETQVTAAIIQSEASEHSSRMLAMKSATDNALSLSEELTLVYNKLRQEQITYEIADITRAQLSLKH